MGARAIFLLAVLLVSAAPAMALDAPNGRKLFKQRCAVCHVIREDGRSSFGPNLAGVIGRPAGTVEGYPYSDALRASGLIWSAATLEAWIADPEALVPGTSMKFAGLDDHDERAALVAYLVRASE